MRTCTFKGCGKKYHGGGYCSIHYGYWYKYGNAGHIPKYDKQKRQAVIKNGEYFLPVVRKGELFYSRIDAEDIHLARFKWSKSRSGYASGREPGTNRSIRLHRLIMGEPVGLFIDHINGDKLDNRKTNLRIVTQHENGANSIHSITQNRNIYYQESIGKYRVRITVMGTIVSFGSYDTLQEAIEVRDSIYNQLWGKYSYTNRQK